MLCQPLRLATIIVVCQFYANLVSHAVKKVRVRGVSVDFRTRSINEFYHLEPVHDEAFNRLQENPNYLKVLRMLTND